MDPVLPETRSYHLRQKKKKCPTLTPKNLLCSVGVKQELRFKRLLLFLYFKTWMLNPPLLWQRIRLMESACPLFKAVCFIIIGLCLSRRTCWPRIQNRWKTELLCLFWLPRWGGGKNNNRLFSCSAGSKWTLNPGLNLWYEPENKFLSGLCPRIKQNRSFFYRFRTI